MNLTGIGGKSRYGCKVPDGISCRSVSDTYAQLGPQRAGAVAAQAQTLSRSDPAPRAAALSPGPTAGSGTAGAALRSSPRILRLWVKPWEDQDGDLHDQSHVYVQVDNGQWQLEHAQRRIREAHAALRPPARSAPTRSAPPTDVDRRSDAVPPGPGAVPGLASPAAHTAVRRALTLAAEAAADRSSATGPQRIQPAPLSRPPSD